MHFFFTLFACSCTGSCDFDHFHRGQKSDATFCCALPSTSTQPFNVIMHENLYTYAQLTLFFIDIWFRPYCIMSAYRETAAPTIRCHIHAHLCRCVSVESHNIAMINAIIVSSTVWLWSQTSKKIIAQMAQDFNENKHHKMLCTLIVRQLQLRGCCINEVCSQLGEERPISHKCIIWKFRKVNYICIEFERSHPYEMNLSIARLAPSPAL